MTLDFPQYFEQVSNIYQVYKINVDQTFDSAMTYEELIEFGGISNINAADLTDYFLTPFA